MILSNVKSAAAVQAVVVVLGLSLASSGRVALAAPTEARPAILRTRQSGPWSVPATWAGGKPPAAGARVQVRTAHTVTYDLKSDQVIRSIHVAGALAFSRDRDTRLDVGLIKIQSGEDCSEHGFDCDAHIAEPKPGTHRPALEVGTPDQPIPAKHTGRIPGPALAGQRAGRSEVVRTIHAGGVL